MDGLAQGWVKDKGGLEQAVEDPELPPGLRVRVRAACANREVADRDWRSWYLMEQSEDEEEEGESEEEDDEEDDEEEEEEEEEGAQADNGAEQQGFWGWLGSKLPWH